MKLECLKLSYYDLIFFLHIALKLKHFVSFFIFTCIYRFRTW